MAKGDLKPMLAASEPVTDFTKLKYPLYASPKIDGCRGMVVDGILKSRTFKQFPNNSVHNLFSWKNLSGLDGEIVIGDPTSAEARRLTAGYLNSIDKVAHTAAARLHVFDCYTFKGGYKDRYLQLVELVSTLKNPNVVLVPQKVFSGPDSLERYEAEILSAGYEGVIVRSLDGPYKFGRSTHKEGYMLKVKRFLDAEAEVIEFFEEMENQNAAEKDNFGRTKRSSAQEGLVGKARLGGFLVRDCKTGVEFSLSASTLGDVGKAHWWKHRKELIGKVLTYKYFPHGVKDKPLLPTFVAFRDPWDLDK